MRTQVTDYIDKAIEESKKECIEDQPGKAGDTLVFVSRFWPFRVSLLIVFRYTVLWYT